MQEGKLPPVHATHVNWRGLYQDSKWAWLSLLFIMVSIIVTVSYLGINGYFTHRSIGEPHQEKVKILDISNYLGYRLLIEGEISHHLPMEIKLPKNCIISRDWINKTVSVEVVTQYRPYNSTEFYEFPGIYELCNKKSD